MVEEPVLTIAVVPPPLGEIAELDLLFVEVIAEQGHIERGWHAARKAGLGADFVGIHGLRIVRAQAGRTAGIDAALAIAPRVFRVQAYKSKSRQ